jgi:uncharacterized MAPEG superfamily protein
MKKRQTFILIWEVVTFAVMAAYLSLGYIYLPIETGGLETAAARVAFGASWLVIPSLSLVVGILAVMYQRFTTDAIDPLAGTEQDNATLEVLRRYLQNTVEQLVLYGAAHLAFAAVVEPESMKLVPLLAVLFLFARIVFLLGYLRAPMWRTPGYALTFYPTLVVALYASYRVVVG